MAIIKLFSYLSKNYPITPHFVVPRQGDMSQAIIKQGWQYSVISYGVWAWPVVPGKAEDIFRERLRNMEAVQQLVGLFKRVKPDMVLTNTVVIPWAALAAGLHGLPHIWYVHEYGDLDHGLTYEIGRKAALEDVGMLSDLVIANSHAIQNHLATYIDDQKIQTLYIPYDMEHTRELAAQAADSPYSPEAAIKIGMIGRTTPSKGQYDAVKAVALLKQQNIRAELAVMGHIEDASYYAKIENLIETEGLDGQVHFMNFLANPMPIIREADVCIMSSRLEAYGQTTFEYLTLGKPVIGTDSGATPEMVEEGVNGFLYDYGDAEALAGHIKRYIEDKSLRAKHSRAAHKRAETMMNGPNSSAALFDRFEILHKQPHVPKLPNFVEQLVDMPRIAINYTNSVSFSHRIGWTTKRLIRKAYDISPPNVQKAARKALGRESLPVKARLSRENNRGRGK